MSDKPIKLVWLMMVIVMAIAPLRGLWADVIMSEMDHSDQDQMSMIEQHDSMLMVDAGEACDQCDMKQCCQASICNSGHCYSCMAIMPLDFQQPFTQLIQVNQSTYQLSNISFQISPLLQPPKV